MLKKRSAVSPGTSAPQPSYDGGQWAKAFPLLVEFLTSGTWEDGSPRETGTLTISAADGMWRCSLRDRAQSVYCFLSGRTPGDLFASLEKGLAGDSLDWRADKPLSKGGAKRG